MRKSLGPQDKDPQRKRTWVDEAFDSVIPNDHSETTAMADMCRAAMAIEMAKKKRVQQTADARNTHEVFISKGIERQTRGAHLGRY